MIRPFPWHALPRVSREHVRAAGRVRRLFPRVDARAAGDAVTLLVGHGTDVEVRRVFTTRRFDLGARGPVIVLGAGARCVAVECEAELALAIVGTLAGGKVPRVARGRSVDPEVAGALAGVLQHLARTFVDELAILATFEGAPPRDALAAFFDEALQIDLAVRVGALRTSARVLVAVPELDATPRMSPSEALALLGDTPFAIPVVLAATHARAGDLRGLSLGDVVVLDGGHRGLALALPGTDWALSLRDVAAQPGAPRRVVVEGSRVELAAAAAPTDEPSVATDENGATMQLPALSDAGKLAEELAELPLAVRIEVGSATLAAREWAALAAGDVLVLDRRVGDPVTLRVAGREVARGELVEVDGALAVRITERTT